jgi:hypothetical protein
MPQSEPAQTTKRIAKWKDVEYPTVYANMMGIGMTPFDINIIFGEVLEGDENSITGLPKTKILLSPEQAANLIKLVSIALDAYVKVNGPTRTAGAVDVVEASGQFEANTKKIDESR